MKRIRNFVKNTFKNLPKEQRDEIVNTVTQSLVEKIEDLMESGLSLEEAIDKTVVEFGTAEDYFDHEKKEQRFKRFKTLAHYRNDLYFSLFGSLIIVGILIFVNLYFTGDPLWFVIPSIAILWWPLVIGYRLLNRVESKKGEKDE
jgi:uncharacterized protein (UPF0305 family)